MNKRLVKQGKTKDVYEIGEGVFELIYKDTATGKDGKFDPGENQVGLEIDGLGNASLRMTEIFFREIEKEGIKTHMISCNLQENSMLVQAAEVFGNGLECICRCIATGSFLRRYSQYAYEGMLLGNLFEISVKDDEAGDPMITSDALVQLYILKGEEYQMLKDLTQLVTDVVSDYLEDKGCELWDIKVEFGKNADGEVILIDEISAGSMRVYKDGVKLDPIELSRIVLED